VNSEGTFRLAFWVLIALMMFLRIWFAIRVRRAGERLMPDKAAIRREGWKVSGLRLTVFLLLISLIVLLLLNPTWGSKLKYPLPPWLRWSGCAAGLGSLGLLTWTHTTLGTLWSPQLQLRANHRLVAVGPYSRIRHPMYTAIVVWTMSLGFVVANWVPVILAIVASVFLAARVPREERMMLEKFGEEYREYMKKTGRFLPKW
jgi:protein-S-isoprenylcysteine O-methyltransferase Ste14